MKQLICLFFCVFCATSSISSEDITDKATQGKIYIYERHSDPWFGETKNTYTWKNKTVVDMRHKPNKNIQLYLFGSDMQIFDEKSYTLLVELPLSDFNPKINTNKETDQTLQKNDEWTTSYTQPAPTYLPCSSDFHMKSNIKFVDSGEVNVRTADGIKVLKVLFFHDNGSWSHCGPSGTFKTTFTYSPELKIVTSVEFVIFRDGSIRRGVKTELKEIK